MADSLTRRLRATFTIEAEQPLWTRPFLFVCGTHLLAYGSYAAVNPTFAAYLGTVTGSESLVGLAFGVFTFAAVIARPVTGWLLDRVGRRAVQAAAAVALASATLSFAWVSVIWTVILLRVVHGIAWGINSTATPTIAADVVPAERRAEGFGYFGVLPNVALVSMPPISLWAAHRYGFEAQFGGAALLALLALGPIAALDDTASLTGDGEFFAREAVPVAALVSVASVPVGAIDALLPLYAPTVGLANAGLFFTVMGAAIVLARSDLDQLPGSASRQLSSSFALQACGLAALDAAPASTPSGRPPTT
jgi:MFS family permease